MGVARGVQLSAIARWTYTNTATIRPFLSISEWGGATYGPEYQIDCTWASHVGQVSMAGGQSGAQGAEMVMKHDVFTEDARPGYLDQILLNGETVWEEIQQVTSWDMSPFSDTPDYKLVTA